ncbi:hypothetical protein [Palleronia sp. LCG004]|uniref:hypothetical protein n=1 Tax=Palleronia sp. LCG004 TaxID=3079304 RepID=UPI002941D12B|nr:hypothetical protein [Palleronia sp. LCG004]WOI56912.1 hypothetical protein RVY76_03705 [Palleronia sp. LCG004]
MMPLRCVPWQVALIAGLSACGPQSPDAAARVCEERARGAEGPTGSVGIGIGSRGTVGDIDIGVTSDYLSGRNPDEVYQRCMNRRLGPSPFGPYQR